MNGKCLKILEYPDLRLQRIALPIDKRSGQIDEALRQLMDDMLATIYSTRSIGLAAPQVDVLRRLIVIDVSPQQNSPLVLLNPEILSRSTPGIAEEQCLSVPGVMDKVARALQLQVRALDRNGQTTQFAADGLLAVCIQHEIDHLDGKLFIDYLSCLRRARIRRRLSAQRSAPTAAAG
jgi:peptide deformylase